MTTTGQRCWIMVPGATLCLLHAWRRAAVESTLCCFVWGPPQDKLAARIAKGSPWNRTGVFRLSTKTPYFATARVWCRYPFVPVQLLAGRMAAWSCMPASRSYVLHAGPPKPLLVQSFNSYTCSILFPKFSTDPDNPVLCIILTKVSPSNRTQQSSTMRQRESHTKHKNPSQALLDGQHPLDEEEQEAVLRALAEDQLVHARMFGTLFGVGAAGLALFFLYATLQQYSSSWMVRYTGELRTVASQKGVLAALAAQSAALTIAAAAMLASVPGRGQFDRGCMPGSLPIKLCLWASAVAAAGGGAYWAAVLRTSTLRYGWEDGWKPELLWLPLGPLAYCLLCVHTTYSLTSTGRELLQLQRLRYSFKKV